MGSRVTVAIPLWLLLFGGEAMAQTGKAIAIIDARLHVYDDGPALRESESLGPGDGLWVSAKFSGYALKTDEEKGSMRTALGHGWGLLVDKTIFMRQGLQVKHR